MSDDERAVQNTQHAFSVAWGWFAEQIGLIQALQAVPLHHKKYTHPVVTPKNWTGTIVQVESV